MENKAVELLKRCWSDDLKREYGVPIPDSTYKEAIDEAKQTQRAMIWYFVGTVVFGAYTIIDLLSRWG